MSKGTASPLPHLVCQPDFGSKSKSLATVCPGWSSQVTWALMSRMANSSGLLFVVALKVAQSE